MDIEIIKTVGQIAGIGGIAIGALLIVFRDVVRKNIFPRLSKDQAFRLLRLIVILVWTVSLFGIAAWTYAFWDRPLEASNIYGQVDLLLWSNDDPERKAISVLDESKFALPLRKNDTFRVEATLSQPAYAYIVWIASDGKAVPLYPGKFREWERPKPEKKVQFISIPNANGGQLGIYKIKQSVDGMETLVLLASLEPLPPDFDLKRYFSDLPVQRSLSSKRLIEFTPRRSTQDRGPVAIVPVDDPVYYTQNLIKKRFKPHFPLVTGFSFAYE